MRSGMGIQPFGTVAVGANIWDDEEEEREQRQEEDDEKEEKLNAVTLALPARS